MTPNSLKSMELETPNLYCLVYLDSQEGQVGNILGDHLAQQVPNSVFQTPRVPGCTALSWKLGGLKAPPSLDFNLCPSSQKLVYPLKFPRRFLWLQSLKTPIYRRDARTRPSLSFLGLGQDLMSGGWEGSGIHPQLHTGTSASE